MCNQHSAVRNKVWSLRMPMASLFLAVLPKVSCHPCSASLAKGLSIEWLSGEVLGSHTPIPPGASSMSTYSKTLDKAAVGGLIDFAKVAPCNLFDSNAT